MWNSAFFRQKFPIWCSHERWGLGDWKIKTLMSMSGIIGYCQIRSDKIQCVFLSDLTSLPLSDLTKTRFVSLDNYNNGSLSDQIWQYPMIPLIDMSVFYFPLPTSHLSCEHHLLINHMWDCIKSDLGGTWVEKYPPVDVYFISQLLHVQHGHWTQFWTAESYSFLSTGSNCWRKSSCFHRNKAPQLCSNDS